MFVGNMFVLTMTIPLCNEHSQKVVLQDLPASCSNSITTCLAASPAALQISRPISVSWPLKNCRQWVNTAFLFILYIRRTCSCKTSCSTDLKAHSCLLEPPKNWAWWVITPSLFIPHIFITLLAASPAVLQISGPISVSWLLKNCRRWVNTLLLMIVDRRCLVTVVPLLTTGTECLHRSHSENGG